MMGTFPGIQKLFDSLGQGTAQIVQGEGPSETTIHMNKCVSSDICLLTVIEDCTEKSTRADGRIR